MRATHPLFHQPLKLAVAAFFLLLAAGTQAQTTRQERIRQIRQDYHVINTDTTLQATTLDGEEFLEEATDGGGELKGWYRGDNLVKMTEWVGLSHGNHTRAYYFKRGQLFFVYETFESFVQEKDGLDKTKTKTSFEARYYVHDGVLVYIDLKGKPPLGGAAPTLKAVQSEAAANRRKLDGKKKG